MSNVIPFKRRDDEAPASPEEERLFALFRGSLTSRKTGKPSTDEQVRTFVRRFVRGMAERGYELPGN